MATESMMRNVFHEDMSATCREAKAQRLADGSAKVEIEEQTGASTGR